MADIELDDSAEALDAQKTAHVVPVGIWALFGGLIVWGIYYFIAYIGWDQAGELKGGGADLGTNIVHTVAYTAIPAAIIIGLAVAMSRRTRRSQR